MDNRGPGTEFVDVTYHSVVKACANSDQHITIMHGDVRFIGPVHPQHADELWVGSRIRTQPHEGIGDGETQGSGEAGQFLGRIVQNYAATGVNHGPFSA